MLVCAYIFFSGSTQKKIHFVLFEFHNCEYFVVILF